MIKRKKTLITSILNNISDLKVVTGTDADLRKLSMAKLHKILD